MAWRYLPEPFAFPGQCPVRQQGDSIELLLLDFFPHTLAGLIRNSLLIGRKPALSIQKRLDGHQPGFSRLVFVRVVIRRVIAEKQPYPDVHGIWSGKGELIRPIPLYLTIVAEIKSVCTRLDLNICTATAAHDHDVGTTRLILSRKPICDVSAASESNRSPKGPFHLSSPTVSHIRLP